MPTLVAGSGPLDGRRFELDGEIVLGREDATITLADEETSRRHAAIRVVQGAVVIEDLGSTNGTYVDGRRITTATTLSGGETIKMGQTIFHLEVEAEAEPEFDSGSTRIAQRPETLADPDRTTMRARPPLPPEPPADPDRTALRQRPRAPEPARAAPAPPSEPPAEPSSPFRKSSRRAPESEPEPATARAAAPAPARAPAAPAATGAPAAAAQPFGGGRSADKRRRGAASRKLAPTLVSYATIIATAAALVAYFAGR
jgi:predicted component of type VI protein secretion system